MPIPYLSAFERFIRTYFIKTKVPYIPFVSVVNEDNKEVRELINSFETRDTNQKYANKVFKALKNVNAEEGTTEQTMSVLYDLHKEFEAKGVSPKLLSVGCGIKGAEQYYAKIGYDTYGVDIEITKDTDKLKFHNLNTNDELPFPEDYFDVVVCQEVIEHIENPWLLFRKVNRCLKEGGSLIVTTPNIQCYRGKKIFINNPDGYMMYFIKETVWQHINPIPFWEIKYIAKYNGFSFTKVTGNYEYFVKYKPMFGKNTDEIKRRLTFQNNNSLNYLFKKVKKQTECYIPTETIE